MISVGISCFGSLDRVKHCVGSLVHLSDNPANLDLVVVDFGGEWKDWLTRFIAPHVARLHVHDFSENRGVPWAYNFIRKVALSDPVILVHNDVLVFEKGWDLRISETFRKFNRIGVVGVAGARGVAHNGLRGEFWSNMLEAEIHGSRGYGLLPVAVLDGMLLACSKEMLESVGGFDEGYNPHHFYDLDISLASHFDGFRNLLCGIRCHHLNGQTANHEKYHNYAVKHFGSAHKVHENGMNLFNRKWSNRLPVHVEDWLN